MGETIERKMDYCVKRKRKMLQRRNFKRMEMEKQDAGKRKWRTEEPKKTREKKKPKKTKKREEEKDAAENKKRN